MLVGEKMRFCITTDGWALLLYNWCITFILLLKIYSHGQHNFGQAEISDLIEYGAHIQVLSFARHPIPVPVLNESKLSLVCLENFL